MDNRLCDGGGNRDMMRWPAKRKPLASLFDSSVGREGGGFIPCACVRLSLAGSSGQFAPRRLLALDAVNPSLQQRPLRNRVLKLAGFCGGETVQVWSEVTLRDKNVNYRLDYVLRNGNAPPASLKS